MAQRTGADGFLAPLVKVASARALLALAAAAALALCGCGGGSDDASTQSTAAGGGQGAAKQQQQQQREQALAQAGAGSRGQGQGGGGQGSAQEGAAKVKQGPPITPPKGPRTPEATPAELANATVADISLQSPSLSDSEGAAALPATYTCDGKGSWPELSWTGIPAATKELILFVVAMEPTGEGEFFYDWSVAGLDPSSEGIEEAKLPKGAILGKNSFGKVGYEICPPQGKAETYLFALYALPKALDLKRGFDPAPVREQVLELSGNVGLLPTTYGR